MDDILTIDGVDGIMIGPADLGWSMGYMPHEGEEEVDKMFQHVLDKCIEHNVPWGMFTSTYERAEKWLTRGGKIATVGADSGLHGRRDGRDRAAGQRAAGQGELVRGVPNNPYRSW